MPTWVFTVFGWLKKAYDLAKLAGAYLIGRAHQRKKQEEAAKDDKRNARLIRDEMEDKTEDQLDDILGGGDRPN